QGDRHLDRSPYEEPRHLGVGSWELGFGPNSQLLDPNAYRRSHSHTFHVYPLVANSGFKLTSRLDAAVTLGRKYNGKVGRSSASTNCSASMADLRVPGTSVFACWLMSVSATGLL